MRNLTQTGNRRHLGHLRFNFSARIAIATLFLILAVIPVQALAAPMGHAEFTAGSQKVRVNFESSEPVPGVPNEPVTQKDFHRFVDIFRGVMSFAAPLKSPSEITLRLAGIELEPAASMFDNEITLGVRFAVLMENKRVYAQHPAEMIPVAAHEFGHLVFAENVLPRFPQFRRLVAVLEEGEAAALKLEELQRRIRQVRLELGKPGSDPLLRVELVTLAEEYRKCKASYERLTSEANRLYPVLDLTSPYNEFFADVVAVLYTEDPDCIANAVHFTLPGAQPKRTQDLQRSEVENRAFRRRGTGHVHVLSPHAVLHGTRNFVWDEYLKRPSVLRRHKREVLHAVTEAIVSEVQWILSLPKGTPRPTGTARNQRLSSRIAENLKNLR